VADQNPEVALGSRRIDLIDLAVEELALRGDQGEVQLVGHGP
jgi:hypothetical protein